MAEEIDEHFRRVIGQLRTVGSRDAGEPIVPGGVLTGEQVRQLFDAQLGSRQLDLMARELGKAKAGYYSIGSSGHEGNAGVAAALRPTDPALLHYRSGGFFLARAAQVAGTDPLRDVLRGVVASTHEPISGGRHKVFGSKQLAVLPSTSTIASHLPRAVGLAFGLDRANQAGLRPEWPADAIVVCSLGDASANHSTAVGAINSALHCAYQGVSMPLLIVCEDNGIGISVRTPGGWIEHSYAQRQGLPYFDADGSDLLSTVETTRDAADFVRTNRKPAFLRLRTVRLMGHAGSDLEQGYRSRSEITADYPKDPVLATARLLVESGVCTPDEILAAYADKHAEVSRISTQVQTEPRFAATDEVTAAIPPLPATPSSSATPAEVAGDPVTLAQAINHTLGEQLAAAEDVLVFGEDVARKGGVYGVTKGLQRASGATRVFDTLLDEQTVLGTALGAGLCGFLPIPEIQYLAYVHNAIDQIRGEAATMGFFSAGQYRNPMVVRIAGYAYQKGFGGHFHNDNSVAALRDIPGVLVASPSRADDAAGMLRGCVAAAREQGRVVVYLEPIALYHTRDLHEAGDEQWLAPVGTASIPVGSARTYGTGTDLTLVSFGNGVPMSLRVLRRLADRGINGRVLDLRWLAPLPVTDLLAAAGASGRVLVVDETRQSGGVSESVFAALVDHGFTGTMRRVTSTDSFVPLGPATEQVLLGEPEIEKAALDLLS
ncbi:2-oxoisovalerate dehydrogenase E1 component [Tamaricihabitans halophyticus]|uniref:2-oxoisovalerate dehydrogenase E1 component n=1 Tax=Tamaricihabitans halophyticus TaxID=1262583 RepID=A0A4R2QW91_9PSEU|nr:thiamine pyrophosphate-dependent enzyme [Tamaricihabitans halophyticus]TCP54353.1 2-oxoisovalerate dehydrogenase E1 component [Tamaricihabitans halophyticus]